MSSAPQSIVTPGQFVSILAGHPKCWLVPALVVAVLAAAYALVRPATWEASQALIVRNEAAGSQSSPGKFSHSDEMKTVQETILELAGSRTVLAEALREIGPPAARASADEAWPGDRDVDNLRKSVKLDPPKGAEFGSTEIFYLRVRDRSRPRAVALVAAICDQLEARFQQLRDTKAQSMIDELVKAVDLARDDLDESTARLKEIEQQVGSDLAELRGLQEWGSGDGQLGRTITEIRNELRDAQAVEKSSGELLVFLRAAQEDPSRLVATPNRLLEAQPALKRLKDGLVDAQLRSAELRGRMSDSHPLVLAARESEQQVSRHLHNELATAISGVDLDLRLNADRVALLEDRLEVATHRLGRLAALRADYANLIAETRNRTELLERGEEKLAEARVSQATAKAASLIGRVDAPEAGTNPVGPRRAMIVLVGLVGGLLAGLGTVLLTVDLVPPVPADSEPTILPVPLERRPVSPKAAVSPRPAQKSYGEPRRAAPPVGVLSLKQALHTIATEGASDV